MVGLCRLCASLQKVDNFITIRDDSNGICDKIRKCCQINIKLADALPKSVCKGCIYDLNNSYKFYAKAQSAQETLQALFPTKSPNNNVTVTEGTQPSDESKCSIEKPAGFQKLFQHSTHHTHQQQKHIPEQSETFMEHAPADKNDSAECEETSEETFYTFEILEESPIDENPYEMPEVCNKSVKALIKNEGEVQDTDVHQQQLIEEEENCASEVNKAVSIILNESHPEEVLQTAQTIDNEIEILVEGTEYTEDENEYQFSNSTDTGQSISNFQESKHFSSPNLLLQLNCWKNYKFECFACDAIYPTFIDLSSHIVEEHIGNQIENVRYKCYDCKKIITRYNFFLNHIRSRHHPALKLRCDICDLSCETFRELSRHRNRNCAKANSFARAMPCNECFKNFYNLQSLQTHKKLQHDTTIIKIKYQCTQCNKEFQYKSCLKAHRLLHEGTKKFSCTYCDRSFYNKLGLEQHQFVHIDEKLYKCNICDKSYKTFQNLSQHQKVHAAIKDFKCQYCDRAFIQKIQLQIHERQHTGESPYPCDQCDKRFRYRSALFAHSKIHTGKKPYSCEYCTKIFADSSNRNKHVRRMHLNNENKEKSV